MIFAELSLYGVNPTICKGCWIFGWESIIAITLVQNFAKFRVARSLAVKSVWDGTWQLWTQIINWESIYIYFQSQDNVSWGAGLRLYWLSKKSCPYCGQGMAGSLTYLALRWATTERLRSLVSPIYIFLCFLYLKNGQVFWT